MKFQKNNPDRFLKNRSGKKLKKKFKGRAYPTENRSDKLTGFPQPETHFLLHSFFSQHEPKTLISPPLPPAISSTSGDLFHLRRAHSSPASSPSPANFNFLSIFKV